MHPATKERPTQVRTSHKNNAPCVYRRSTFRRLESSDTKRTGRAARDRGQVLQSYIRLPVALSFFVFPSSEGGLVVTPLRASNEGLLRPRVARVRRAVWLP